jgi:serine/threonine protein kinase/Tol biopolymer transport system component
MIGKNLAQYAIESPLGAGGMGEVYRARDTRLGRNVAIKVLPQVVAADSERLDRFEREAKVLAALNHPNIAALYGFEAHENLHFLVMELAEGETLAERIARGPIPVDEALKLARQIAEALEAAHEKGIIHRDLKPANIKVSLDGKVKVLDFGLAKAIENIPNPNTLFSNSPTAALAATNPGMILGTAAYMSPEQAKGLAADARSDIFSFGCVLYEMLTGRQPFQGDTIAEIIASVIARSPELTLLPVNINPRVPEAIRRCLEKDPRQRWQAVAGVRAEIDLTLSDPRGVVFQMEEAPHGPLWKRALPALAGILAGAVIAGAGTWFLKPAAAKPVARFVFAVSGFNYNGRQVLDISRDGTQFVYVSPNRLQLKPIAGLDFISVQGLSIDARNPALSPDGKSIVFWTASDQTLKRIPTSGGTPVTLCRAENPFGMNWATDDQIVYGQGPKGIFRVSANGGQPELIVAPDNNETLHGPQVLPGGHAMLFTAAAGAALRNSGTWDEAKIYVQPLPSGTRKLVVEGGTDARYLPTGHLIYGLGGNLLVVPFDAKKLAVTGRSVPVVEGVATGALNGGTGTYQFGVSETGTLIYVPGVSTSTSTSATATSVVLVEATGQGTMPLALPPNPYTSVRFSPDGTQIALSTDNGKEADIWIYDLSGKISLRRLTLSGRNYAPVWSGDSKYVLFTSDREKDQAIYRQLADGTGVAERLTKPEKGTTHIAESWLPGNNKFSFRVVKGDEDVWIHSMDDNKDTPLIVVPGSNQHDSMFSPDGRWIAYRSDDADKAGLYVEPYPPTGARYLLGANEGAAFSPVWAPDGKTIYFHRAAVGALHSLQIHDQPNLTTSNPADLGIVQFRFQRTYRMYDIASDGKRFAIIRDSSQATAPGAIIPQLTPEIRIVLNWFTELKNLTPSH